MVFLPPGGSAWEQEKLDYWNPNAWRYKQLAQWTAYENYWKRREEQTRQRQNPILYALTNIAETLNYILGATGINPLSGYAAQAIHQYATQHNIPESPITQAAQQVYNASPAHVAQQAVSGAVSNVSNALASVGKAIHDAWEWFVSVAGKWGPIILLVIILFLVVKLVRG